MKISSSDLQRVIVFGGSGSGKTTFAHTLSQILSHEIYSMDDIFWLEGWKEMDDISLRKEVSNITASDTWVIDGNYTRTLDISLPRATLVVMLRIHPLVTIPRIIKRTIGRNSRFRLGSITPLPKNVENGEGNILEAIRVLSSYSIRHYRIKYYKQLESTEKKKRVVLHSPRQVNKFLNFLRDHQ